ncbi:MAG: hypothetical protein IJB68_01210 [Ruminococcus sp.]|nr:hypothetical protein [Ruminococcus sp.]
MSNNIDKNQLQGLLNTVSKKIGVAPEQLRKELEEGKFDSALSAMNQQEAAKFQQAVKNPALIEKLMSTPQAKALYNKLTGGK